MAAGRAAGRADAGGRGEITPAPRRPHPRFAAVPRLRRPPRGQRRSHASGLAPRAHFRRRRWRSGCSREGATTGRGGRSSSTDETGARAPKTAAYARPRRGGRAGGLRGGPRGGGDRRRPGPCSPPHDSLRSGWRGAVVCDLPPRSARPVHARRRAARSMARADSLRGATLGRGTAVGPPASRLAPSSWRCATAASSSPGSPTPPDSHRPGIRRSMPLSRSPNGSTYPRRRSPPWPPQSAGTGGSSRRERPSSGRSRGCTALHDGRLVPGEGVTDLRVGPSHALRVVDALLTGMHDLPQTSHFAFSSGGVRARIAARARARPRRARWLLRPRVRRLEGLILRAA